MLNAPAIVIKGVFMRRLLVSTSILLLHFSAFSQQALLPKNDRAFLSTAYYDIYESNISNELLESLVLFVNSFGDKALAKDIILNLMLFSNPIATDEQAPQDSKIVLDNLIDMIPYELPGEEEDIIGDFLLFIAMRVLLETPGNLFEVEPAIKARLTELFPLLMEKDAFNDKNDSILVLLKEYPQEFKNAVDYFAKYYNLKLEERPDLTPKSFFEETKAEVRRKYPVIDLYMNLNSEKELLVDKRKIATKEAFNANPKQHIRDVYVKLFYREPEIRELDTWVTLVQANPELTLEIVYFVIMSSEEYQYH